MKTMKNVQPPAEKKQLKISLKDIKVRKEALPVGKSFRSMKEYDRQDFKKANDDDEQR